MAHAPDGRRRQPRFTLPSELRRLIQAQNPLTGQTKFFVSNAPIDIPVERLLHVAFARWHVERSFQDEKGQLGLDEFECRRYAAVQRHLILTAISHLFLARTRMKLATEGGEQGFGGKKSRGRKPRPALPAAGASRRRRFNRGGTAQAGTAA